jgi:2-isopropylmalate synthase
VELGQTLSKEQLNEVYARFTELADRKKTIYDQDLLSLLQPAKETLTESVR